MASIKSNGWTFDFNNSNTVSNDQKKLRLGLEVMTNKHLKHKLRVNLPLDQIQSIPAFFYPDNGLIIKNEQDNVILKFSPSESLMMCSHQVKYANYYQEELAKPTHSTGGSAHRPHSLANLRQDDRSASQVLENGHDFLDSLQGLHW